MRRPRPAPLLPLALAIGGCTVGPDYHAPSIDTPTGWTGIDPAPGAGVVSKSEASEADVTGWWKVFNDPTLDRIVALAARDNLSLAQAESRLRQARAARTVAASGLYPDVSAGASYTRGRVPVTVGDHAGESTTNLFRAGLDATWEIDMFGGIRRGVEAADAQIDSAYFDHESVLVSIVAETALAYFQLRGAQHQVAIARETVIAQQDTLDVTRQRFEAGFVSSLDVANAQAQVSLTASQIPAFESDARAAIYSLSVLVGKEPGALLDELSSYAPLPVAPEKVPVGLPSELLKRRPDLRRAEADLHAATANIGVAVADQYPRFSLTGSFGTQGQKFSSLGTIADRFWSFGPAVSLPIFTGGQIQGNIAQAREVAEQAALNYRSAVLVALQEVETALVGFTREQERRASLAESVTAGREAVNVSLELYTGGKTDFLDVLTAQGRLYASQAALAQSETNVGTDLISLYKALGGGWSVEPKAAEASPTAPVR